MDYVSTLIDTPLDAQSKVLQLFKTHQSSISLIFKRKHALNKSKVRKFEKVVVTQSTVMGDPDVDQGRLIAQSNRLDVAFNFAKYTITLIERYSALKRL